MVLETKNIRYAHADGHTDVCYGSDTRNILTCGNDGNVRVWNGSDDDDPTADSVAEVALAVACSRDKFYVATDNNYVQSFTYPERKRDKIIFRFSAPVTHITVSSSTKYLAAGSCDMEIQILNCETNKIITLMGHTAPVLGVVLDPLDEYLVSSSCDGTVRIWNLISGLIIKTFFDMVPIKNDFFKALCLGRSAWKSVSGSALAVPKDTKVVVYKRSSWEISYTLASNKIGKPTSILLFSPCGNYIAAASIGGEIIIWEIKHKSEVCHYIDSKKVGISGMAWHPDGSEIAFTDRLGRLAVLTGINEEISKHVVPEENNRIKELPENMTDALESEINMNGLFDVDDDDDNCISLEKIKAPYKYDSENEEAPKSPSSSVTGSPIRAPMFPLTKPQPPFQPSSTPLHFEPRCLCYNSVGIVRYYDAEKTVDVQFHDTTFHHALFLRSFGVCTMAALSMNLLCLAVPSTEENQSKLSCLPLSSWAGNKEWTVYMSQNEDIVSVTTGDDWIAVATTAHHLRIFSHAGTQKQILSLPGPVVCMSGFEKKLLVVCHMGVGVFENQNEGFTLYKVSKLSVRVLTPFQPLPLFPKSFLKWAGFTDEGTPCTFDSEGLLRLLAHDNLHWQVICDLRNQRKSMSDNYFVIGLSERYQNVRCVLCRNSQYPLIINTPTVLEIPLKLPLCDMDSEKSQLEETYWRLIFSLQSLEKTSADNADCKLEISSFEQTLKQTALKLFAEACRNSEDLRALEVASLMSSHPLEMAVKYASKVGKMYLAEKLNGVTPVNWKGHHLREEILNLSDPNQHAILENWHQPDRNLYSQQDLFEDYSRDSTEKGNRSADQIIKNNEHPKSLETPKISSLNPFKKIQAQKNEGPRGLDFFDTLITKEKETCKEGKSFFQNKQISFKPLGTNKAKGETKAKKPTFVQWFSTKKASLSEEYPNVSGSDLTKLGMQMYKKEINQSYNEEKTMETNELKKRTLEEVESESETKRCKS